MVGASLVPESGGGEGGEGACGGRGVGVQCALPTRRREFRDGGIVGECFGVRTERRASCLCRLVRVPPPSLAGGESAFSSGDGETVTGVG